MAETPAAQARWHELTKSECFDLLAHESVGRLAVVDDHGPIILPVNYVLDHHMVVFRTDEGTKLHAANHRKVAFEIDGTDAETRAGWSVLVRGEAAEVTNPAEIARLRELPLEPWAPGTKAHYVRILPAVLSGRRITVAENTSSERGCGLAGGRGLWQ